MLAVKCCSRARVAQYVAHRPDFGDLAELAE
jgi:hypothetical protein